eukprot:4017398-Ditylum_brightwellii.AAC.1
MGWANPQEEMEPNFNFNKNALHSRTRAAIALTNNDKSASPANTVSTNITQHTSQNVHSQEQQQMLTGQIAENVVALDILERRLAAFHTEFQ